VGLLGLPQRGAERRGRRLHVGGAGRRRARPVVSVEGAGNAGMEVRSCWRRNRAVHGAPPRKVPSQGRSIRPRMTGALPLWTSGRRPHDAFHEHEHHHHHEHDGVAWTGCRGVGSCSRRTSLRPTGACSPRWSWVLWGCRREGRSDGDGAFTWVLGGGVLGRWSRSRCRERWDGGQVVLATQSCSPRGASAEGPLARTIYPATDYGGSAPLDPAGAAARRPLDPRAVAQVVGCSTAIVLLAVRPCWRRPSGSAERRSAPGDSYCPR